MTDPPTIGPFEPPPRTFTDREGRQIELRSLASPRDPPDALVAMYANFDRADRAQGLPPVDDGAIEDWLDHLLEDPTAVNVVASHDDRIVGHATLAPDDANGHELAIFVHQDFQAAGIGTRLLRALLGEGARSGARRVWLTVERWNRAAVALYEKVGFERRSIERFTLEMHANLAPLPDE